MISNSIKAPMRVESSAFECFYGCCFFCFFIMHYFVVVLLLLVLHSTVHYLFSKISRWWKECLSSSKYFILFVMSSFDQCVKGKKNHYTCTLMSHIILSIHTIVILQQIAEKSESEKFLFYLLFFYHHLWWILNLGGHYRIVAWQEHL